MPPRGLPVRRWSYDDLPHFERGDTTREEWEESAARRRQRERRDASIAAQEQIHVDVAPPARPSLGLGCNDVVPTAPRSP